MGPTDIIRNWYESEIPEVQGDIAFFILSSLDDGVDMLGSLDELSPRLIAWLTPGREQSFRTVGKAVSFVAVFEHVLADRFKSEGWALPRELFQAALEDAPTESMVETARRSLADMPRREALWHDVGVRWKVVKDLLGPEYMRRSA